MASFPALCGTLETIFGHDIGQRGIAPLLCKGDLAAAAQAFLDAPSIIILSGFPCNMSSPNPSETDGPSGATALVSAALSLNKRVCVACDDCTAPTFRASLASRGISNSVEVHGFPPKFTGLGCTTLTPGWEVGGLHALRLESLLHTYVHTVAIERAGVSESGEYFTMRRKPMGHLVAPLDALLSSGSLLAARTSTGIGDGGNEVGMGKVLSLVQAHIPLGSTIGCTTKADHLLVAGVSNWGGWGLCAAVEALAVATSAVPSTHPTLLPTLEEEEWLARALADVGAGDGCNGRVHPPGLVDGFEAHHHHAVLLSLQDTVKAWRATNTGSSEK